MNQVGAEIGIGKHSSVRHLCDSAHVPHVLQQNHDGKNCEGSFANIHQ